MSTLKKEWSAIELARLQKQASALTAELEQQDIRGYERPTVEVVNVSVEKGFAASDGLAGKNGGGW